LRPYTFFAVAEEEGVRTQVDRHCFADCLAAASRVAEKELLISVNLFPETLHELGAAGVLEAMPAGLAPERVCLQLPLAEMIGGCAPLEEPLQRLKDEGMKIAVKAGAVGRGFLESLVLLQPDVVKVGREHVQYLGVEEAPQHREAVRRLVLFAHRAGAEVHAVGVESESQRAALAALGVAKVQGALWGEPRPSPGP
jgi:EAL domain-containing protein (putative c-di-GMP-specific phosphodiesterase class I)